MTEETFARCFHLLTGNDPFPWQAALYQRFISDSADNIPASLAIPTGLGKTCVLAIWLLAYKHCPERVPRRLVYVVNRRTVVDQTTEEATRLQANARKVGIEQLAVSTLRGQFADNREWSADPASPAVICGTVDMIGSRLLFSGYGVGFKARPLHAGFLGQDALLIHDEAHLEPAFQKLLQSIVSEQARSGDARPLRVMQMTATTRGQAAPAESAFGLTAAEATAPESLPRPPTAPIHHAWLRLQSPRRLHLHRVDDEKKSLSDRVAELAARYEKSGRAVVVFLRKLEAVGSVAADLNKLSRKHCSVIQLTGTMRGLERDGLIGQPDFRRFLKSPAPSESADSATSKETATLFSDLPAEQTAQPGSPAGGERTVFFLCTSAGEVGIDLSADHMICDLAPLDSMIQRLGRVNRYGLRTDTQVDVVHPDPESLPDPEKDKLSLPRKNTLALLRQLGEDASPRAIHRLMQSLPPDERAAAFTPEPTILPATEILFDAWSLTSIREPMPGRPPVEPWLHGVAEWEPPQTQVAWREEVSLITGELLLTHPPADLLDDYPLMPHELLADRSDRVHKQLSELARGQGEAPVWLIDTRGEIDATLTLAKLVERDKEALAGCTVLLPPGVGGLSPQGLLDGSAAPPAEEASSLDVADRWVGPPKSNEPAPIAQRARLLHPSDEPAGPPPGMRAVRHIELAAADGDADGARQVWTWFVRQPEGERAANAAVLWQVHVDDVTGHAASFADRLGLPGDLREALILAAKLHDHGKRRASFQRTLGNTRYPEQILAKSNGTGAHLAEPARHEFASLLDALHSGNPQDLPLRNELSAMPAHLQDLVLHLIAAHHGRARPHFNADEAFDSDHPAAACAAVANETIRRFARLQRRYGRWGLAYLESLLRAADWAASAEPSQVLGRRGQELIPS